MALFVTLAPLAMPKASLMVNSLCLPTLNVTLLACPGSCFLAMLQAEMVLGPEQTCTSSLALETIMLPKHLHLILPTLLVPLTTSLLLPETLQPEIMATLVRPPCLQKLVVAVRTLGLAIPSFISVNELSVTRYMTDMIWFPDPDSARWTLPYSTCPITLVF